MVLPDTYEIEIHVKAPDHDTTFTVDGQESAQLGPADMIKIHRGRHVGLADPIRASVFRNLARQAPLGIGARDVA